MKQVYFVGSIFFAVLSNAYAYDLQEGEKNWDKWTACSIDEECIPIHNVCGGWTAVNKQFEAVAKEYQSALTPVVDCAYVKMEPEPKALCLEQACTVKPTHLDMK